MFLARTFDTISVRKMRASEWRTTAASGWESEMWETSKAVENFIEIVSDISGNIDAASAICAPLKQI